jgi:hypothetical protein
MSGPTLLFAPVGNPKFDLAGIKSRLRTALRDEGTVMKVLMQKTTKTWKHKPTFAKDEIHTPEQIGVTVGPNLKTLPGRVWMYLDGGTKIRWAVMSGDWRSKTRPGVLGSRPGRGRAVIWGRRAMTKRGIAPRPGIQARHWSEAIHKLRAAKFEAQLKREFDLIARDTIK